MIFWTVKYTNTQIQKYKFTNTKIHKYTVPLMAAEKGGRGLAVLGWLPIPLRGRTERAVMGSNTPSLTVIFF